MNPLEFIYTEIERTILNDGPLLGELSLESIIADEMNWWSQRAFQLEKSLFPSDLIKNRFDENLLFVWADKMEVSLDIVRRVTAQIYIDLSKNYRDLFTESINQGNLKNTSNMANRAIQCADKALEVIGLTPEEAKRLVYGTTDTLLICIFAEMGLSRLNTHNKKDAAQLLTWSLSYVSNNDTASQWQQMARNKLSDLSRMK